MRISRFLTAALTAGLLTSAAFAVTPTADQVAVPQGTHMGQGKHEGKIRALFQSPEELAMFRMQMHQEMRNLPREQRKAYKKSEFQKIRAMSDSEKASWRKDLDSKWAALSPDRQQRIQEKMQRHDQRHAERKQQRMNGQAPNQNTAQPQQ